MYTRINKYHTQLLVRVKLRFDRPKTMTGWYHSRVKRNVSLASYLVMYWANSKTPLLHKPSQPRILFCTRKLNAHLISLVENYKHTSIRGHVGHEGHNPSLGYAAIDGAYATWHRRTTTNRECMYSICITQGHREYMKGKSLYVLHIETVTVPVIPDRMLAADVRWLQISR